MTDNFYNSNETDNNDMSNGYDFYDLFNIEYNDIIYDLFDEVNDYSNSHYINFYNKGDIGSFVNLIYNNIDYVNSSIILNNIKKREINEVEIDINEYNNFEDEYY